MRQSALQPNLHQQIALRIDGSCWILAALLVATVVATLDTSVS